MPFRYKISQKVEDQLNLQDSSDIGISQTKIWKNLTNSGIKMAENAKSQYFGILQKLKYLKLKII